MAVGRRKDGRIETREGSLGGQVARYLKIAFGDEDRTAKQREYFGAKQAVLRGPIENCGMEIGASAYRAAVGHMMPDRP